MIARQQTIALKSRLFWLMVANAFLLGMNGAGIFFCAMLDMRLRAAAFACLAALSTACFWWAWRLARQFP